MGKKKTARETEWERAGESEEKWSYRRELSKDDSNFLMESPEAEDQGTSKEEGNGNNSSLWG